MTKLMPRPSVPILIATLFASLMVASCSKRIEDSAGYKAACHGPPVHSIEEREKAMVEGYEILRAYDCISKSSFDAVAEEKAKWEAAHTPEAIAKSEAEFAEKRQQYAEKLARESAAKENEPKIVLRLVNVNTATETEIANVISVGPEVAARVIKERNKRRFSD
jgi:DNA uptake protein ComE-like DNA-binding protein